MNNKSSTVDIEFINKQGEIKKVYNLPHSIKNGIMSLDDESLHRCLLEKEYDYESESLQVVVTYVVKNL